VSFEICFDSKQLKLEPKLVSALSKTKRLFRLFCFYIETESFDVSIEPKQTEDQPKQFDREHIFLFFTDNFGFVRFFSFFLFSVFFRLVSKQFVSKQFVLVVRFYIKTEIFDVSIEPKQTEDPPQQLKREYIWVFSRKFRVVLVCYLKQFFLFRLFRYRFETPKQTEMFSFWFHETNRNKPETVLVSVCFGSNRNIFCLFRGHPSPEVLIKLYIFIIGEILNRETHSTVQGHHRLHSEQAARAIYSGRIRVRNIN
jgi:hypothetical protein